MSDDDRKFVERMKEEIYFSECEVKRLLSIIKSQEARIKELETELKNRSGVGI